MKILKNVLITSLIALPLLAITTLAQAALLTSSAELDTKLAAHLTNAVVVGTPNDALNKIAATIEYTQPIIQFSNTTWRDGSLRNGSLRLERQSVPGLTIDSAVELDAQGIKNEIAFCSINTVSGVIANIPVRIDEVHVIGKGNIHNVVTYLMIYPQQLGSEDSSYVVLNGRTM